MNTPTPRDVDREFEEDPTGIGALLRAQPDPGPMPAALADRITASLRAERDAAASGVASLSEHRSAAIHHRDSTPQRRSNRTLRVVGGLGAAAAIGAVAVLGYQASQSSTPATNAGQSSLPADLQGKVFVQNTGANYTRTSLGTQAAALLKSNSSGTLDADKVKQLGSIATPAGAMSCASSIGADMLNKPDKVTIDIAKFENQPALVIVVDRDGKSTAWAVSRDCKSSQKPLAGPTSVTT
ncbi:hypothetical protein G9U51_10530 [Calidifontibacter sp. DB0510]|uniref:Uncharacterized protein n=1 Tax=Metallococcus carri TaxID=1656884 RepID=A0A967B2J3_9MICO|nr:hypothetical protein [Metallococcus carri]NHN56210.1 hypothetical protein [Metallococcus carri]NOP38739.1 hypothetical protein [Calidifontibacter sp. DB2511S]